MTILLPAHVFRTVQMSSRLIVVLNNYTVQRVAVAILTFAALLAGAALLDQAVYAQILVVMFLTKFLQISNLGAVSGFFVSNYSQVGMFKSAVPTTEVRYIFLFSAQLFGLAAPCALVSTISFPQYTPGLFAFILFIPLFSLEPIFRIKRIFYFSLMPDILLSISLFFMIGIRLLASTDLENAGIAVYLLVLATFTAVTYLFLFFRYSFNQKMLWRVESFSTIEYIKLLQLGMPVYLGSALFMVVAGADRFFLPLHASSSEQAVYLLAYQLTTGAMIFLVSINFINTIDLGQAHQSGGKLNTDFLKRKLLKSIGIAILSLTALFVGTTIVQLYFLEDYVNLLRITMTLASGLSLFFIAGTITPVLAYLNKQVLMTIVMGLIAAVIVLNNILAMRMKYDTIWLATVTALCFGTYGIIALLYTFRVLSGKKLT